MLISGRVLEPCGISRVLIGLSDTFVSSFGGVEVSKIEGLYKVRLVC